MSNKPGGGAGVKGGTRLDRVKADAVALTKSDPKTSMFRLFGSNVSIREQPNGSISVWGMPCPWCKAEGDKESAPLFIWKNRNGFSCRSCGINLSLTEIVMERNSITIDRVDDLCDAICRTFGTDSHIGVKKFYRDSEKFTDNLIIDVEFSEVLYNKNSNSDSDGPTIKLTQEKIDWINNGVLSFISRAEAKSLYKTEKEAVKYIFKRGISEATIKKAKLFVGMNDTNTEVAMPSYDSSGNLVGYQYFYHNKLNKKVDGSKKKTKNSKYRNPPKGVGSCVHPFGVDTCIGKKSPILIVCGFFDYLSALEIGIECVLSPFGTGMLVNNCDKIKDVVEGKNVSILFDRKIQELNGSIVLAKALVEVGASVSVMCWMEGSDGFDLNDYLLQCKSNGVTDPKQNLVDFIKNGKIGVLNTYTDSDVKVFIDKTGLKPVSNIGVSDWGVSEYQEEICPASDGYDENDQGIFEPNLEKSLSDLNALGEFDTFILFTCISSRIVMCDSLDVKPCGLKDKCSCVSKSLDISDGRFSSAFVNNQKMLPAIEAINGTNDFMCPIINKDNLDKRIVYKSSNNSSVWTSIDARSLFSSGSHATMLTNVNNIVSGIFRVKGFMSLHCGMMNPVYVVNEMTPWSITPFLKTLRREHRKIMEYDFSDIASSIFMSGLIGTPDMVLVSSILAWAFSPPVIPLIKDIGRKIANYRQPSLSIYIIGDPATGKTNTIKEVTSLTGFTCNPIDAKMATRPGLIISGSDGSPGHMSRCIGGYMGLDEITDRKGVLEIVQLVIENRISISMNGRNIDEVVPVRVALLSNANAERKKLHEFRTPMEAASDLMKEHLIRRVDFCIATRPLLKKDEIFHRNYNFFTENITFDFDSEYLLSLGSRCRRQDPSLITIDDSALEFISNDDDLIGSFQNEKIGNPMMYGDVKQRVFRVACGIAGLCGSFDGEKMIVKISHIKDAICLMDGGMTTMGASTEARFRTRTMDSEAAAKVLASICSYCFQMLDSSDENMKDVCNAIINFIQACSACDPGSMIDTGINDAFKRRDKKTVTTSSGKVDPYKRAWRMIKKMKDVGLIVNEKGRPYSVTETFARAIAIMETDNPSTYKRILEFDWK